MRSGKILLIERDRTLLGILKEYLEQFNYVVTTAADGLEGLDLIKAQDYEVLIVDIHVQMINGLGLIKIARELNPQLPIISMSIIGEYPELNPQEEATCILHKPFQLAELSQTIHYFLTK